MRWLQKYGVIDIGPAEERSNESPDGDAIGTYADVTLRRGTLVTLDSDRVLRPDDRDDVRGDHQYTMTFAGDKLPPVRTDGGFWSLTMYDAKTRLLVPNERGCYSLGDRSDLTYGEDGSLTVYIQHDKPAASEESNWLPAPEGEFYVVLRMYYPEAPMLLGQYEVPGIVKR